MTNKIKKKIKKLKSKINKYSFYYFNKNKSLINDEKYDFLIKKLEKLEKKYPLFKKKTSPTININYKLLKQFKKKKHNIKMLSIKNEYSTKKIYKYINKIRKKYSKIKFSCELKIDGIALSILYKNNYLYRALTRGNGIYGEDITKNIKFIKSIPEYLKKKNIKKYLEVRGEIFIKKKDFIHLNKKKKFSSSRNLTSGTIRLQNKKILKKRKLSFIGYDININNDRTYFSKQSKCLKKIKKIGFKIDKNTLITKSFKKIVNFYKKIKKNRKNIGFDIDGIVIKINNKKIQNNIKNNRKYIKWAIAWKFPSEKKVTKLIDIKYKVGKNGIITPIGIINTININGTNINNINLYNLKYLKTSNINIQDYIIVEKSGDVIPKIYKILKNKKNKNNTLNIIKKCPSCKKKINIYKNKPKCFNNLKCPQQFTKTIINFISKNGFNIINLGSNIVKKLIKYKYIKCIPDIFKITKKQLMSIPKIKYKLAKKILYSINYSKNNIKIKNLIYSLSIPYIGISTSEKISKSITKFKKFIFLNKNKKKIQNISKLKYKSIINYLNNNNNFKQLIILNKLIKTKIK